MSEHSEWVAWVGPARQGDVVATEKLGQYFSPFVHAILLSRLSHRVAQTQVKPVLDQAMTRLGMLSKDETFGTWLLMAARERAFDAGKAPGATVDQPSDDPLVNEALGVLGQLRLLAETSRERLAMRLLEGIGGAEVAEVMGGAEADVRADLERAAATFVQQLTGQPASFVGDTYLWALVGTPHPALVPLENQLTSLRYSTAFDPEPPAAKVVPEPSRSDSTEPSGGKLSAHIGESEHRTQANPIPSSEKVTYRTPSVSRLDPANPFGVAVKTIHASDLPAAADFADLQETKEAPKPSGTLHDGEDDEEHPTVAQALPPGVPAVPRASESRLGLDPAAPTELRPTSSKPRGRSLPPAPEIETDESTALRARPSGQKGWRGAGVTSRPPPMRTETGLPAVLVRAGGVTRSWRPFAIASAFTVVAIGVAMLLFDGSGRRSRSGWTLVPVVVAAADLPEGTIVTFEMVSQRSVPEQFVTSSVVKPESTQFVVNQRILVGVQAGDPLLWTQFEATRAHERLSKRLSRRMRAYDVITSKAIAVGGWVQPNDRIDLIASLKSPEKGAHKGSRVALTLLQDVSVLTTGKISAGTLNAVKDGEKDYVDVTVLLTPEEAEAVALIAEVGELQFTLRADGDHESNLDPRVTDSKTLLEGKQVKELERKRMRTIQQIRSNRQR